MRRSLGFQPKPDNVQLLCTLPQSPTLVLCQRHYTTCLPSHISVKRDMKSWLQKNKDGYVCIKGCGFFFCKIWNSFSLSLVFWESSISWFLIPVNALHVYTACIVIIEIPKQGVGVMKEDSVRRRGRMWPWGRGCDLGAHGAHLRAASTVQEGGIVGC